MVKLTYRAAAVASLGAVLLAGCGHSSEVTAPTTAVAPPAGNSANAAVVQAQSAQQSELAQRQQQLMQQSQANTHNAPAPPK